MSHIQERAVPKKLSPRSIQVRSNKIRNHVKAWAKARSGDLITEMTMSPETFSVSFKNRLSKQELTDVQIAEMQRLSQTLEKEFGVRSTFHTIDSMKRDVLFSIE